MPDLTEDLSDNSCRMILDRDPKNYIALAIDRFTGWWYCPDCRVRPNDNNLKSGYKTWTPDPDLKIHRGAAYPKPPEEYIYFINPPMVDRCQKFESDCEYNRFTHDRHCGTRMEPAAKAEIAAREKALDKAINLGLYFICQEPVPDFAVKLWEGNNDIKTIQNQGLIRVRIQGQGKPKWVSYRRYQGEIEEIGCSHGTQYGEPEMLFFITGEGVKLDINKTYDAFGSFHFLFGDPEKSASSLTTSSE